MPGDFDFVREIGEHFGVAANAVEGIPSKLAPKVATNARLEIRMFLAETDISLTSP